LASRRYATLQQLRSVVENVFQRQWCPL
jgi:hypothetical protein